MKKYIGMNNCRRSIWYWVSILAASISPIAYIIGKFIESRGNLIKRSWFIPRVLATSALMLVFILGVVFIINYLAEEMDAAGGARTGKYAFFKSYTVRADIFIGIVMLILDLVILVTFLQPATEEIRSLIKSYDRISWKVLRYWMHDRVDQYICIVVIFVCSIRLLLYILYIYEIIPIRYYRRIKKELMSQKTDKRISFCISNTPYRSSAFASFKPKNKKAEIVLDDIDLAQYQNMKIRNFRYFTVILDMERPVDKRIEAQLHDIMNLLHAEIYVLEIDKESADESAARILEELKGKDYIKIIRIDKNDWLPQSSAGDILYENKLITREANMNPVEFIQDNLLMDVYMSGIRISVVSRFIRIILNKLDKFPAIYALFDLIDMQYRIRLAYEKNVTLSWMKENSRGIGNINKMKNMIGREFFRRRDAEIENLLSSEIGELPEGRSRKSWTTESIMEKNILPEEMKIIKKYLPNYKMKKRLGISACTVHLTTSLRNVLRGHGMFELADVDILLQLIFKLALLNSYILDIKQIEFEVTDDIAIQEGEDLYYEVKAKEQNRSLSPLIVADKQGTILLYNNWIQQGRYLEYVNYLDGSVILPGYVNLSVNIE